MAKLSNLLLNKDKYTHARISKKSLRALNLAFFT